MNGHGNCCICVDCVTSNCITVREQDKQTHVRLGEIPFGCAFKWPSKGVWVKIKIVSGKAACYPSSTTFWCMHLESGIVQVVSTDLCVVPVRLNIDAVEDFSCVVRV